jgi:hypothetical protein
MGMKGGGTRICTSQARVEIEGAGVHINFAGAQNFSGMRCTCSAGRLSLIAIAGARIRSRRSLSPQLQRRLLGRPLRLLGVLHFRRYGLLGQRRREKQNVA